GVIRVGLFVDMDDDSLRAILLAVPLDLLQLHGGETPDRVAHIRSTFGLAVMKAMRVAGPEDIAAANRFLDVADRILFDAKAPSDMAGALPGGNALAFDWPPPAGPPWEPPRAPSGGPHAATG